MRIGMVYDVIYPYVIGGFELRNWELAKRLSRRGHQVTLLGMKYWQGDSVVRRAGVTLHGVCPARELYTSGRRAIWPPVVFALSVLGPLARGSFDVVDVASFPYFPLLTARLAALRNRARLVATWIEVWGRYWSGYLGARGAPARGLEWLCTQMTDTAIAISGTTRRDLVELGYRGSISVIPCGVDTGRIADAAPSHEASDVIFAGRLIKEKGVCLLLGAIDRLVPQMPNLKCTIIGDGPERASIAAGIERRGLRNNVRLLPFLESQDELFALMKAARVFVLPSSREGFGIVALEANACGLPVVTTRHPRNAAVELVRDGENGLLCDPTEADLAEKLRQLLHDSAIPRHVCATAAAEYDWDNVVVSLEQFYQTAIPALEAVM